MFQPLIVAALAATAAAIPQHGHQHLHYRRSGSGLVTGTGSSYANSTGGIYSNTTVTVSATATSSIAADEDVVTVTVEPVAASGSSDSAAATDGSTAAGTCAASRATITSTATEYVTVTVGASSSAASSSTYVAPASTTSSSSADDSEATAAAFYVSSATSSSYVSFASSSSVASSSSYVAASSSTASSTSSSASSSSTSSSSSSSKRGLAYNDADLTQLFSGTNMGWAYNWASSAGGSVLSGLEYIPQIWCSGSTSYDDWEDAVETALSSGAQSILGFNEPDESTQCDISASDAASGHQTYMNPFSGKAKLGSPAVTNGGSPMGLTYMQSFFDACDGNCAIDFMVIHWYSSYYDGVDDDFKSHVQDAITLASDNGINEVWVTEFALNDASEEQSAEFLESVLPWLDSESAVGKYAFFMCRDGLLTSGDAISEVIGAAYIS